MVAKNPMFFLQMILDMAEYANQLIRLSNKGQILGSKAQSGVVQYEAVELLFCLSFLLVMSQHRPLYKDLLPHLHKRFCEERVYVAAWRKCVTPSVSFQGALPLLLRR
ncbi:telomerase reverse transcriptase-like isoform X2 [Epinephelus moara]|uniref:telomerase reverse transcriptase-like isoform X2 n=1 Tax=Epinephelus moara TaxID=300413 RepID=UPI00214F2D1A|nr:telomerase reverse transcriptase-like isoform X2 [Epinephelus moara]